MRQLANTTNKNGIELAGTGANGGVDITDITSIINNINTYSTTEKAIGTWIDEKTIYRKVIYLQGEISTDWFLVTDSPSIDTLIKCDIIANQFSSATSENRQYVTGSTEQQYPSAYGTRTAFLDKMQHKLYLKSDRLYYDVYLIVDYTKYESEE